MRKKTVTLRLTEEEYKNIKLKMKNAKERTISSFIRTVISKGEVKVIHMSDFTNLLKEINHIGHNINQTVKYIHNRRSVDKEKLNMLIEDFNELDLLVKNHILRKVREKND